MNNSTEYIQIAAQMLSMSKNEFIDKHPLIVERLDDIDRLVRKAKPDGGLRSTQIIATIICEYLEQEGRQQNGVA